MHGQDTQDNEKKEHGAKKWRKFDLIKGALLVTITSNVSGLFCFHQRK